MTSTACGGALLTGGASRRLGVDKARLRLDGESLASRAARLLASVCDDVVEVGPGCSGLRSVEEDPPGSGPLAALVAGADVLGTRSVLLVAVDLPGVPIELLRLLADWPGDETVLPVAAGREQYVCARYGVTALQRARRELAAGARSLHSITSGPDVARVDEGEWTKVARPDAFADVDTPADVARVGLEPPG